MQVKAEYSQTKQQAQRTKTLNDWGDLMMQLGSALMEASYHEGTVKNCLREGSVSVCRFPSTNLVTHHGRRAVTGEEERKQHKLL